MKLAGVLERFAVIAKVFKGTRQMTVAFERGRFAIAFNCQIQSLLK